MDILIAVLNAGVALGEVAQGDEARVPEPDAYLPLTPAVLDIMLALGEDE